MNYKKFTVGPLQSNAHLFYTEQDKKGILFDIGGDENKVISFLSSEGIELDYIFLTHGHADHLFGVLPLKEKTGAKIVAYKKELEILKNPVYNLSSQIGNTVSIIPDITIENTGNLKLEPFEMCIYHTPGHTEGSICILIEDYLVTGDTLFAGSVGRMDLYSGNKDKMKETLKIFSSFSPSTKVLPGHGENTTIEKEIKTNPFLRESTYDLW